MTTPKDPTTGSTGKRIVEDTMGATVGAAVGAGLSMIASLALPLVLPLVPIGLVGGTIAGILFKELAQRRRTKEEASNTEALL